MRKISRFLLSGISVLTCMGCATTTTVGVSGTNKAGMPIPPHVTYVVLPTSEVERDPAFSEYQELVTRQMDARGYKRTSEKAAQLGVFLAYATQRNVSVGSSASGGSGMGAAGGIGSGGSGSGSYGMTAEASPEHPRYTNQLVIVIVDLQQSRTQRSTVELWRGETFNTSHSNNLQRAAPLMVDAAFRHFGDTTAGQVQHTFGEKEADTIRGLK